MRNSGKVVNHITVSPLDPSDYDLNKTKVRLEYLDNTIKGIIVDYINNISENKIQTPDMGEDNTISKLAFSFDI